MLEWTLAKTFLVCRWEHPPSKHEIHQTNSPVDFTGFVPASILSKRWAVLLLPLQHKTQVHKITTKLLQKSTRSYINIPRLDPWTEMWGDLCLHGWKLTDFKTRGFFLKPPKRTWRGIMWMYLSSVWIPWNHAENKLLVSEVGDSRPQHGTLSWDLICKSNSLECRSFLFHPQ